MSSRFSEFKISASSFLILTEANEEDAGQRAPSAETSRKYLAARNKGSSNQTYGQHWDEKHSQVSLVFHRLTNEICQGKDWGIWNNV